MAKNAKPVSDLAKTIANLGLNFAEKQVEKKIADPLVEQGVKLVFPVTRELLEVLNDDNAANAEQVKDVVMDWINDDLSIFLHLLSSKVIDSIEDENHKALLGFAFDTMFSLLSAFTDQDANNKAQVKEMVDGFIHSERLPILVKSALVVPLLEKSGASADLVAFVEKAVDVAFDAIND